MTVISKTSQGTSAKTGSHAATRGSFLLRLLNRIAEVDRRYREDHKLSRATPEQFTDMGITEKNRDTAFYSRRGHHITDQPKITIRGAW